MSIRSSPVSAQVSHVFENLDVSGVLEQLGFKESFFFKLEIEPGQLAVNLRTVCGHASGALVT
ncbi:MAG: hypothetical protein SH868_09390 [Bythopirellula sp.]|nr:hypothetical protein [Bythopirellula sp.]